MNKYRILAILIIILWLPFSIPIILIGAVTRLIAASFLYGFDSTNDLLYLVSRKSK